MPTTCGVGRAADGWRRAECTKRSTKPHASGPAKHRVPRLLAAPRYRNGCAVLLGRAWLRSAVATERSNERGVAAQRFAQARGTAAFGHGDDIQVVQKKQRETLSCWERRCRMRWQAPAPSHHKYTDRRRGRRVQAKASLPRVCRGKQPGTPTRRWRGRARWQHEAIRPSSRLQRKLVRPGGLIEAARIAPGERAGDQATKGVASCTAPHSAARLLQRREAS